MGVKHVKIDITYIKCALDSSYDVTAEKPVEKAAIGLPLCKQICKELDGDIKVKSRQDKGIDFAFSMKVFNYSDHPALKTFTEDKLLSFDNYGANPDSSDDEEEKEQYSSLQDFIN